MEYQDREKVHWLIVKAVSDFGQGNLGSDGVQLLAARAAMDLAIKAMATSEALEVLKVKTFCQGVCGSCI